MLEPGLRTVSIDGVGAGIDAELIGNILNYGVSARLLPQDKCLDTGDDLFVVDEAIEELLPIFG